MKLVASASLLILLSATSTSAACAWVLWSQRLVILGPEKTEATRWESSGYETAKECRAAMEQRLEVLERDGKGKRVAKYDDLDDGGTFIRVMHRMKCLPDTVRPD
jgi:hypothetical protein